MFKVLGIYNFTLSMPLSNFIALIRTSYFPFFSLDGKFPFLISNLIKNTVHRVWLNKKQRKILYIFNKSDLVLEARAEILKRCPQKVFLKLTDLYTNFSVTELQQKFKPILDL